MKAVLRGLRTENLPDDGDHPLLAWISVTVPLLHCSAEHVDNRMLPSVEAHSPTFVAIHS